MTFNLNRILLFPLFFVMSCTSKIPKELHSKPSIEFYNSLMDARKEYENIAISDKDFIVKIGKLDQLPRQNLQKLSRLKIEPIEAQFLKAENRELMAYIDKNNLERLISIKPEGRWFKASEIGKDGAKYAFLIIQHAPHEIQTKYFDELSEAAKSGEIQPDLFAMFYDRVMVGNGKKQKYGSQFRCVNNTLEPYPIEDIGNIDKYRKETGFLENFEQYSKTMREISRC